LISAAIGCVVIFVIGILIGRFATCPDESVEEKPGLYLPGVSEALVSDGDPTIAQELMNSISNDRIRKNLRYTFYMSINYCLII
jgi:hypothetical protein